MQKLSLRIWPAPMILCVSNYKMSKNVLPFYFSLDNLIHFENSLGFNCNFFLVNINQKYVIIGKCPKNFDKNEIEQSIYSIKDFEDISKLIVIVFC